MPHSHSPCSNILGKVHSSLKYLIGVYILDSTEVLQKDYIESRLIAGRTGISGSLVSFVGFLAILAGQCYFYTKHNFVRDISVKIFL